VVTVINVWRRNDRVTVFLLMINKGVLRQSILFGLKIDRLN
jgi:hypothetical protein